MGRDYDSGGNEVSRDYTTRASERGQRMALGTQARDHALSQKRLERLADVGRAENQSLSPETHDERIGDLVADVWRLESEIAQLQKRNENQAQTIRVQAETIARLETVIGHAEDPLVVDMREVPAFKRYEVTRITKEGAKCKWTLGLRNYVETLPICVAEALMHLFPNTPQNPPICPKEQPVAQNGENLPAAPNIAVESPETANSVAVPVHTSPQVRWAGGK